MLRSKRITVREAQKSEPSLKENKPSPKKQVQGDHERKSRPRRLEAQKKKHQEGKETHDKRLKKIARILGNHQEARILLGAQSKED